MKKKIIIVFVAFITLSFTSDKPAYLLFNKKGKEANYQSMVKDLQTADIVFFGELHTDPISHWMQLELTRELFDAKKEDLIIGAEMFEADNQLILDEYLAGIYDESKFLAEVKLWGNYKTDYKPVVEFAKENNLPYIATNIPRRYANVVYKQGFEGLDKLSDEAKKYIGPDLVKLYDPEVGCYKDMLKMFNTMSHTSEKKTTAGAHRMSKSKMPSVENYPKAQAAKDATMAHFILENWSKGKLFFHFEGAYHSDNFEGIVWWINKIKPGLNIKTISVVYQEDISELAEENIGRANYIIAVPENMTQTNR